MMTKNKETQTRVVVLQDRSGSMSSRRQATIDGFNEYIQTLKAKEGKCKVTLLQFDYENSVVFQSQKLKNVPELGEEDFVPRGSTALRDATAWALRTADSEYEKGEQILMVIMTDGGENASVEIDQENLDAMIEARK